MDQTWKPSLQKEGKPLYIALVRALSDDIEKGRLPRGFRLPTQRELADQLKIAVGTVTRAYDEAERKGLVYGDGRRGTFVGQLPTPKSFLASLAKPVTLGIDFRQNHPAHWLDPDLAAALQQIARQPDCQELLLYPPPSGLMAHRLAGTRWLESLGLKIDPENVFVSGGAQHALLVVCAAEAHAGDIIASEEYSFPGVKTVADMLGLQQAGVAMDEDGIIPEALEELCLRRDIRLLYLNPSLQNPTNYIMPLERRRQIAAIAEKHNVCVIEDEILSPLLDERPGFISGLIPDRSYFIISSSKSVAAGLRVGYITAPAQARQKLADVLQGSVLALPPLMAEIFSLWLDDGTVEKTIAARKRELAWGQTTACEILRGYQVRSQPTGYHLWLTLPDPWTGLEFTMEAQMRGVAVAPAEIFAVDRKAAVNAVRISIGAVPSREHLKTGLTIIADILSGSRRQDTVRV
ncbi:MAG: PLP-dependent aminotransferase family protein [candidate division Zixibacteria bacterium]|nr:PLP-dependent aminotransferase family protein [candidate division Zixibacteria bacterium]